MTSGPEPSIETDKMLSNREIGFLAGMACLLALSVFLLTILACKGNNKVYCQTFVHSFIIIYIEFLFIVSSLKLQRAVALYCYKGESREL